MSATAEKFLGNKEAKRQHWISDKALSLVGQRRNLIGPVQAIKDLRKQIKRSSRLDRQEMWEEAATSLEKAARAHDT